jgi:hypothetical protein
LTNQRNARLTCDLSGFDPNEIANDLMRAGLELVEDLEEKKCGTATQEAAPLSFNRLRIALARLGQSQRLTKR